MISIICGVIDLANILLCSLVELTVESITKQTQSRVALLGSGFAFVHAAAYKTVVRRTSPWECRPEYHFRTGERKGGDYYWVVAMGGDG